MKAKPEQTMPLAPDFGEWLHQLRKKQGMVTTDFYPVDSGTVARIEKGQAHVRFKTALQICERLNVDLPEFANYFVKGKVAQQDTDTDDKGLCDGGKEINQGDIQLFVESVEQSDEYSNNDMEIRKLVSELVGDAVQQIIRHRHSENLRIYTDQLGLMAIGELLLFDNPLFAVTWMYPTIPTPLVQPMASGSFCTPHDAFSVFQETVTNHNEDASRIKRTGKIKIASIFNPDRFRVRDLLEPLAQMGDKDSAETLLAVFWNAFQHERRFEQTRSHMNSYQVERVDYLRLMLVRLWRWLQHNDDHNGQVRFAQQLQALKEIY